MEISEQKPVGLTGRYINALFELCSEKNNLKKVVSDLESMQNLIDNNKNIKSLIHSKKYFNKTFFFNQRSYFF